MLRVLIVDDEPLARRRLRLGLEEVARVVVVGEAASGAEAIELIGELSPAVVLLDVEMPDGDGFEVARHIVQQPQMPEIVFVTAFDHYAVAAFEHNAADYLLKPAEFGRIRTALIRAEERLRHRTAEQRAEALALQLSRMAEGRKGQEAEPPSFLQIRQRALTARVPHKDIIEIIADRDYVKIRTTRRTYHVRRPISQIAASLHGHGFIRIHRSHIVRGEAAAHLHRTDDGSLTLELIDGAKLPVGRSFRKAVMRMMDG